MSLDEKWKKWVLDRDIVLTPEEWKILENYLAARCQALVNRSLKEKTLEKAHTCVAEIKKLPLNAKDIVTIQITFEIIFTAQELLDEFKRNPSGMTY